MDDLSTLIFDNSFELGQFSGQMLIFLPFFCLFGVFFLLNQGKSYSAFCFLSCFSVVISNSCPYAAGTEQRFGPVAADVVFVPGRCCHGPSLG